LSKERLGRKSSSSPHESNHESPFIEGKGLRFVNEGSHGQDHRHGHHSHHIKKHHSSLPLHRMRTHNDGHIPKKKSAFGNAPLEDLAEVGIGGLSPHGFRTRMIKNTEVTFNFTCANTVLGDQVAMVGSMALLGHWDPMRAVPLTTNPQMYPIWSIKIDLPRDKIIEYKFLIIKASNPKKPGQ
jgi:hypothetical protein